MGFFVVFCGAPNPPYGPILEFAKSFAVGRLSADEFANPFMELWKIERDNNLLQKDEDNLSECLSSIFCLSDLYNPDPNREKYELDEYCLRTEVSNLIDKFIAVPSQAIRDPHSS